MATSTIDIGTKGKLRVRVDLVSQDQVNKTSNVRVRGDVWITSGSSTDNTGNCKAQITGTNSTSSKTIKGSYSDTARLIIDETFVIAHDAFGNASVSYSFQFGPTSTKSLGKGGTVSTSMTLPSLVVKPSIITTVNATVTFPNSINVSYSIPISNAPILEYQIAYSKNSDLTGPTYVSAATSLSKTISGLDINVVYYFQVRSRNSDGWSFWSDTIGKSIPNVPNSMPTPNVVFTEPSTLTISFSPPSVDGGSPITGYDVQYSTYTDYSQATTLSITNSPVVLNNLPPNGYNIRVRAKNLVGAGDWSATRSIVIFSGPKIQLEENGPYYPTIVYVRDTDSWKPAVGYVKDDDDIWRLAGG